jgi:DNA (cytosine-5)-methyltransferase 1
MSKVLDLFCGAGGFALGFQKAGFEIICGIDKDPLALSTYEKNIKPNQVLNLDIGSLHSIDLMRKLNVKTWPDIIIASPPCEPYTLANAKRKKKPLSRLYEDPNGRLVLDTIRLIGDLRPKIFIIENVRNLIEGKLKDAISYEFKRVGYPKIFFNLLYAESYGVPSERKRIFISNNELNLKRSRVTPDQFVMNVLPEDSLYATLPNHEEISIPESFDKKLYRLIWGRALVYFPSAISKRKSFKNWEKIRPNDIAPTVMGKSRFIHPYEARALTVREHASLMTFHNNFEFFGGTESQFDQVGEAVPPLLSYKIAVRIVKNI